MSLAEMLGLVAAVATSFGTGAVLGVGLSKWLGGLWASRILQGERASIERALSDHAHELGLAKSSYDRYLELILDYYAMFYNQYRFCQRIAGADAYRHKETGAISYTRAEFLSSLDAILEEWDRREGRIRLLLPAPILAVHMKAISAFNAFKRTVEAFDTSEEARAEKERAFVEVDCVKKDMEAGLRAFLRTEHLLK